MARSNNNKPATKADLIQGFRIIVRQLTRFLRAEVFRSFKRIEAKIDKLYGKISANQREFLSTERAVIDKLKEHEERIKQLEEKQLSNPWLN